MSTRVEHTPRARRATPLEPGPLIVGGCALALAAAFLGAAVTGAVAIRPGQVLAMLAGSIGLELPWAYSATQEAVLWRIRLPRVCLGMLTGAALATAGAALQGMFRNPLADPGLIGVSTGAALAAAAAMVLGTLWMASLPPAFAGLALPLAAFGGALLSTLLVYRIATRDGRTEIATMLLAGVALNAIAGAGIGLLIYIADEQQLRDVNFWMLGSLAGIGWDRLLVAAPLIVVPTLALLAFARHLNALLLGEVEALHLGFEVERAKRAIILLAALAVGAAVALTGVIGFVGLVVPHLIRLTAGPDHRTLLPASALLGAALLLLADLGSRTIVLPAELPIGILTSCIGGPFFLWLLLRRSRAGMW